MGIVSSPSSSLSSSLPSSPGLQSPPASSPPSICPAGCEDQSTPDSRTAAGKPCQLRPRSRGHGHFLWKIRAFLRRGYYFDSQDLVIRLLPGSSGCATLWKELQNPQFLTGVEADSLKYDFNPDLAKLTVRCMPTPVHDAVVHLVNRMKDDMGSYGFLTHSERIQITTFSGTDVVLPTLRPFLKTTYKSRKSSTAVKQPDAAFAFVDLTDPDWVPEPFPRVVFEVAFSQSYESVLEDARQWLLRGQGDIKLVVIIKLHEHAHGRKNVDFEEISAKLNEQSLVKESDQDDGSTGGPGDVNPDGSELEGRFADDLNPDGSIDGDSDREDTTTMSSQSYSSDFSSNESYKKFIADKEETSAWVGAISGFIEVYRYNGVTNSIFKDGERVDIFAGGVGPAIKIGDLLPDDRIVGDDKRSYHIPLDIYSGFIKVGVRQLALIRKALENKRVAKRKGDHSEFVDESEERGDDRAGEVEETGEASGWGDSARKKSRVGN